MNITSLNLRGEPNSFWKVIVSTPSHVVSSIVPYLNVHLQVFLLQVTKRLSTPCHGERCIWVQVPYAPHHYVGHAFDKGKFKLELWSQGFNYYSSLGLLAFLLVWTLCGIMPEFMTWKHLILLHAVTTILEQLCHFFWHWEQSFFSMHIWDNVIPYPLHDFSPHLTYIFLPLSKVLGIRFCWFCNICLDVF